MRARYASSYTWPGSKPSEHSHGVVLETPAIVRNWRRLVVWPAAHGKRRVGTARIDWRIPGQIDDPLDRIAIGRCEFGPDDATDPCSNRRVELEASALARHIELSADPHECIAVFQQGPVAKFRLTRRQAAS